jgi:2-polyprenyl-3-methyl-5-hydroxy-6-metoxy-1,4-benzoquinol methylase
MQIVAPLNCSMAYYFEFGRLAAEAREVLTHEALKTKPKYLFYWDDDTLLPPLGLYNMHQFLETHPDVGAVTGVYVTREDACEPVVYKEHGQGAYWGFAAGEASEPEEIFSCGAGCLLVRASVVEKMTAPYWADAQEYNVAANGEKESRVVWGHDIRFCVKIQQEANSKLYMMPSVLCAHWDTAKQRAFVLPEDSPPMKRYRIGNWKEYWGEVWGTSRVENAPKHPDAYAAIADMIPEGSNVVDLGCGVGMLMQKLAMEQECHVLGYDASDSALSFARQLYLPVEELDLRNLKPEHVASADVVTCTFVLEYLDDNVRTRVMNICKDKAFFCALDFKADYKDKTATLSRIKKELKAHFNTVNMTKVGKEYLFMGRNVTDGELTSNEPDLH